MQQHSPGSSVWVQAACMTRYHCMAQSDTSRVDMLMSMTG
jgi:hypothetical protein